MPTDYERRFAISLQSDAQQDLAIESVLARGFDLDWSRILADRGELADPVDSLERAILEQFNSSAFRETVGALVVNGQLIAAYAQRLHEELAGLQPGPAVLTFADPPDLYTPALALQHWKTTLSLNEQAFESIVKAALLSRPADPNAMAERVTSGLVSRLITLYQDTIAQGVGFPEFMKRAQEILPDASKSLLETEYRTKLTHVYGGSRYAQIRARAKVFPFIQFMAVRDKRTTWWICLPMGTAGPDLTGYVAASEDPVWLIWTPPNHWQCRSDLSPISYREAQRMKILAADGTTKIARVGNNPDRPFGDPPVWAEHPVTGALRDVEPQEGFGGGAP